MKTKLILLAIAAILLFIWIAVFGARLNDLSTKPSSNQSVQSASPVPPQFLEKSLFLTPIEHSSVEPENKKVTGITVPHHLLASDLIADAFKYASKNEPDQILLISPDHFYLGSSSVSVSSKNFSTVFGELQTDTAAVSQLKGLPFVTEESFFYREHGLGAELPFIKYYFPHSKIIVVSIKMDISKSDLEDLAAKLMKVLSQNSVIVQSTDFSHYLSRERADEKDTQTLNAIEQRSAEEVWNLNQPDNLDCRGCQYVQTRLQKEFFNADFKLLNHKNSQDYTKEEVESTTSYIVQGYEKK